MRTRPKIADRELWFMTYMEARSIAIVKRRRWMELNLDSQIELRGPPHRLAQNLRLETKLRIVIDVLILAASAPSEIWTWRVGPELGSLQHTLKPCANESSLLVDNPCFNSLTGQHEWNKHGLRPLLVGFETSKAIAPVHQFFDRDLQGCHI